MIWNYISFAIEVGGAVASIIALVGQKTITGAELQAAILPAVQGAETAFGFSVSNATVQDICVAIADVINKVAK
jgi:hypothetical protein